MWNRRLPVALVPPDPAELDNQTFQDSLLDLEAMMASVAQTNAEMAAATAAASAAAAASSTAVVRVDVGGRGAYLFHLTDSAAAGQIVDLLRPAARA